MKHWYQQPHRSLSNYVRSVLAIDGAMDAENDGKALVTNGMPALFFRRDHGENRLRLFGRSVPSEHWKIDGSTVVVAHYFKPFAMAGIFNLNAKDLLAKPVDISFDFATDNTLEIIESIEQLIIRKLEENKEHCEIIRYATDQIMYDPGGDVLSKVKVELALNERTFQRIFKKYVGITPVQYRRICQFETSFTQLRANDFGTLTDIAYDNGFSDQSHFIRSFKEFTKTTPNSYLRDGLKKL